jgi:hypothetical protein
MSKEYLTDEEKIATLENAIKQIHKDAVTYEKMTSAEKAHKSLTDAEYAMNMFESIFGLKYEDGE